MGSSVRRKIFNRYQKEKDEIYIPPLMFSQRNNPYCELLRILALR